MSNSFVSWNLDNEELSRFVLDRRICWNSYIFFTFWGTLLFMIDIRKDSIYIRILYENDSKVDSMTSHIGFWLKKNPLENLIVLPLEFSRLERSG